jgi:hypothetical protein
VGTGFGLSFGASPGARLASVSQFAIALVEDLLLSSGEHVCGRDVADGAVESSGVVMLDEVANDAASFFERQGNAGADAFALERLVPSFDLAVGLRIVRGSLDVRHSGDADELLEIAGDELRAVVGDDSWLGIGERFMRPLKDRFNVGFLHFFADFPVDDEAAEAVEDRTLKVECAGDVEVTDVGVPMLMGCQGLLKAGPFFGRFGRLTGQQSGSVENAVDGRRTAGHDVSVEHHVGHPPIAFGRIAAGKGFDGGAFVIGDPVIAWNPGVVFVDFSEALLPVVELAGGDANPFEKATGGNFRPVAPVPDMVDNVVTSVRLDPFVFQVSPSVFFRSV